MYRQARAEQMRSHSSRTKEHTAEGEPLRSQQHRRPEALL